MNREFIGKLKPTLGRLDGIDIANHIGNRDIGGGELLHKPGVAMHKGDGCLILLFGQLQVTRPADRLVGIVVDFAPFNHRDPFVQK